MPGHFAAIQKLRDRPHAVQGQYTSDPSVCKREDMSGDRGIIAPKAARPVSHGAVLKNIGVYFDGANGIRLFFGANWLGCRRRRGVRRAVPAAAMLEDLADHIILAGFYEGNNLHRPPALGPHQRIDMVNVTW